MTKTETDVDKIIAFHQGMTGGKSSKEMLNSLMQSKAIQIQVVEHDDKIIAMRAFIRVVNPFGVKMGWALVEDLANGHDIQPDIT